MSVRVLMYSSTPRDKLGGVQAVYARLATSLRHQGHSVVEAWSDPSIDGDADEEVFPLTRLVVRRGIIGPRSVGRVFRSMVRLVRGLLRHKPEIVNIHFVRRESIYFLMLRRLLGYKVVLSAHGSDLFVPERRNAVLLPHLLPRADAITAVTQRIADRILAYPGIDPKKVHVIPNGVDTEFWGALTTASAPEETSSTIVAVGRLTAVKGHDILINALAQVREHVPDANLVIAGEGEARQELEELARKLGMQDAVVFAGYVSREEIRELLNHARVFALPSLSEGMPLALLEAMAAGVPAVASRVGGVPEVVEPDAGILVPPNDAAALSEALTRVLTDAALTRRLRRSGKARAQDYPISIPERKYAQLFVDLVNKPVASYATSNSVA